ncbi:hypothetical protein PQC38_gp038 [Aeromonas phage BUCT695]|uniref:hypothetical protein n=1 Tax=Aeromonas phage BUCT695 TaxID=2908630 RepID=UPI00232979C4|nr:hypothetical protein PQC38_gp038 [Aeromonas phage BUCT695]UIW10514.1 hypothetical protein [Aeromonas phage BUCT695]
MSVSYDVVTSDGQKHHQPRAVCFGRMNKTYHWEFGSIDNYQASEHVHLNFLPRDNMHPTWLNEDEPIRREWPRNGTPTEKLQACQNYIREMKLLVEDLPFIKDFVSVHPIGNLIRFKFTDLPADQIVTAMFMLRNISNYSDVAYAYRKFRSMGYRPSFCMMMSTAFKMTINAFGSQSYSRGYHSESAWMVPQLVGREGWTNILLGNIDQIHFTQRPWTVQRGYRRDSDLSRSGRADGWPAMMIDCYNEVDETGMTPTIQNRGYSTFLPPSRSLFGAFDTHDAQWDLTQFQSALQIAEEFFNSIGIPPRQ